MAGEQPIATVDTLGNFTKLLDLVKSQNTTQTSSTQSNITPEGVQAIINNILGSTQGLASVAQGQKSAGLYGSSVAQQSINDLITRTAGEIAKQQAGTTTATTTKKQAPFDLKGLALTFAAQKLLGPTIKGLASKTGVGDIGEKLADTLGVGSGNTGGFNLSSIFGGGASSSEVATSLSGLGTSATDVAGLTALDSAAAIGSDLGIAGSSASVDAALSGLAPATTDAAGFAALESGAAEEGSGALATGLGADTGGMSGLAATGWGALAVAGAADAGQDFSSGSTAQKVGDIVGGLGTGDIIKGLESGNAADSINPLGEGLLSAVGIDTKDGSWVICTHLNAVGILSDELYTASSSRVKYLSQETLKGYHIWAVPLTRKLRTSRNLTKFFGYLAKSRCEYLLGEKRMWGWLSVVVGEPICEMIGKRITSSVPDWKQLYE